MWPFRRSRDKPRDGNWIRQKIETIYRNRSEAHLEGSEAIFSAVTRISNSCAMARMHLYRGYTLLEDDPREILLNRRPGYRYNGNTLLHTWHACCESSGNGYLFKVPAPDGNSVQQLDVLNPDYVEPRVDIDTGEVWYRLFPPDSPEMWVNGYEIFHIRHVCTSGIKGINPVAVLRGSIGYDDAVKEFSLKQIQGINSSVVLMIPSDCGKEKKARIIAEFRENYTASNRSLIVLDAGVKADILTKSPIDSHVLDVERITTNRVARVYNIPPHMLGDYSNASYESNEAATLEYIMHTIGPRLAAREAEMDSKWLTEAEYASGCRWVSDIDPLLKTDAGTAAEVDSKLVRSMIKTPNEARAKRRMKPMPNGDELFGSRDLAPITVLKQSKPT